MRTKPPVTLTQEENVAFYVERKVNYVFYDSDFWELIIPTAGTTEVSADGKRRYYQRGKMIVIAPVIKRRITLRGDDSEYISLRFKKDYLKALIDEFDLKSYELFSKIDTYEMPTDDMHVADVISAINSIHIATDEDKAMYLKKLSYTFVMNLVPFRVYNSAGDVTARALVVMNDARNVSLRLPDVAAQVGCSEEYLVRCFKKSGLATPNTIFKHIKLRYARSLLTTMKISVQEVSARVGFKSVGHFNKLYYVEFGVTPGEDKKL